MAHTSKVHTRCRQTQYTPMSRIDVLKALMSEPGRPNWNNQLARELRVLEGNDYGDRLRVELRKRRNEEDARLEAIKKTWASDDDDRPSTFGDFEAEWDDCF